MKHLVLKIRDHFIEPIRNGNKIHEYRLATAERKEISQGDILVLVSNRNSNNYICVQVTESVIYKSWEEALDINWETDFHGVFETKEDAIKECEKFYTKKEIIDYGIICYKINPINTDLKNSRVLLDTNIFIQRESGNNVSIDVNRMFRWFEKINTKKYIHRDTINELTKYNDESIRKMMLAKTESYSIIEPKTLADVTFKNIIKKYSQKENDLIDNDLLLQVYNKEIDYLITDDRKMLLKAKDLFISEYVLSTQDFLGKVESLYPRKIEYDVLSIKKRKFDSYDVEHKFFDTLRQDYGVADFNNWYKKKAGDDIYSFEENGELMGFLYLKIEDESEDYSNIEPKFINKKRLKIGTFKIIKQGLRLGERFLKIIFDNAMKNDVDEIYVTMFENKRQEVIHLKKLMKEFGFYEWGYKKTKIGKELVLVKTMNEYNYSQNAKYNYPLIKKNKVKYGFLPIEAIYHSNLFPDLHLKNENMSVNKENACSYAIEKIYVCKNAKYINLDNGDLLCVYMMSNIQPKKYHSVITGLAVFEEVIYPNSKEEFLEICKDKTVFTLNELSSLYDKGIYRHIVKLLFYKAFDNKVLLKDLRELKVVDERSGPQYSTIISEEKFMEIYKIGSNVK